MTNSLKKKTDQDLQVAEEYINYDLHRDVNESDDEEDSDEDYNPNEVKVLILRLLWHFVSLIVIDLILTLYLDILQISVFFYR